MHRRCPAPFAPHQAPRPRLTLGKGKRRGAALVARRGCPVRAGGTLPGGMEEPGSSTPGLHSHPRLSWGHRRLPAVGTTAPRQLLEAAQGAWEEKNRGSPGYITWRDWALQIPPAAWGSQGERSPSSKGNGKCPHGSLGGQGASGTGYSGHHPRLSGRQWVAGG